MKNIIVCDSSSLISLYKGGVLEHLLHLFEKIIILQAVKDECQNHPIQDLFESDQVEVRTVQQVLFESLGQGEREAVSLAVEAKIQNILIDDLKGFRKALTFGLTPIQAINIVVLAKDKQLISSVKEVLDTMLENEEGMTAEQYEEALIMAHEKK